MHTIKTLLSPTNYTAAENTYKKQILFFALVTGILTCFIIGSHILQTRILHEQETYAAIINHSGRQRMLSQNIVARVLEFKVDFEKETTDIENLKLLKEALKTFISYQSRFMLPTSDSDVLANLNNEQTSQIYKERLDDISLFIEQTKLFIDMIDQKKVETKLLSEYVTRIAHLGLGPVLFAMESLTLERVKQSDLMLEHLKRSQRLNIFLFLAILIMIMFFVVSSELKRQKNAMKQLAHFYEKEKELHTFSALGEISAKIAHEINSPLAAVLGKIEILQMNKDNIFNEKTLKTFESINKSLWRISKIIRLTKRFYRKSDNDDSTVFDLKDVVLDVIETTQLLVNKGGVKFSCNIKEGYSVKAEEHQIFQVINNIIGNAIDATLNLKEREVKIELFGDATNAILQISDNGPGVPHGLENKIFEKLFTTKNTGTGIGLFESQGIVESYSGSIKLVTEISRSCFEIRIPLHHT